MMNKAYLNSNILNLIENKDYTVTRINTNKLLNHNRFDIVIKHIYSKHYKNKTLTPFTTKLYLDHINCINGFVENDDSKKIGKDAFLKSFNKLLDSIEDRGFNSDEIIPLGNNRVILDGAHRLSTQIGFNQELNVLNLDVQGVKLDFDFFKRHGLSEVQLDYAAIEYAKLDVKSHMVLLWPLGEGFESQLLSIFEQYGKVIYHKEVKFNLSGLTQLVRVAYSREAWLGNENNDFVGARNKARWCYSDNSILRAFLFHANDGSDLVEMKEKIRELFSLGKHPVHINDTHEETIELANFLFNKNTVSWANKSRLVNFDGFSGFHLEFKKKLAENNCKLDDFLVVGSILSTFGVKDCKDFDYINAYGSDCTFFKGELDIEYERDKLNYIEPDDFSLIYDPNNYFYYQNVKFLSLENTIKFKGKRKRDNDLNDLVILNKIYKSQNSYAFSLSEMFQMLVKTSFWRARIKMFLLKVRYYIFKVIK